MQALAEDNRMQIEILLENMHVMKSVYGNEFQFQITGFASLSECDIGACAELSARRAELVEKWLIENGLSVDRLLPVRALGSDYLIGDESTEDGRKKNMRVELEAVNRSNE